VYDVRFASPIQYSQKYRQVSPRLPASRERDSPAAPDKWSLFGLELSMTDEPETEDSASRAPMIRVLAQFIKDLSFENPGVFSAQPGAEAPEIELGIDVRVEPGPPEQNIFGVDLRLNAKAKRGEAVVFIIELVYSGVFQLQDASQADAEAMLLVECPRLLFPFARRIVAETTREGGHPPLLIDPIDFVGLYREQKISVQRTPEAAVN
jgi:preprotein translocase subunit SecB